ncbi:hypothetical protein IKE82_01330 [Candidatus Saccharibacteria bacterium]|nr:hypothetical protein [Candidatus Saccharibacteria bacterium]
MAEKVHLGYVEIMMELDEISKEYSTLLVRANKENIPILQCKGAHKELTNMKERLEALSVSIKEIDDYFKRVEANEYMIPLLNAVRCSLCHPLHYS